MTAASVHGAPVTPSVFGTTEVARVLGVPAQRVRAIVRAGLCRPRRAGRLLQFSFQDLVVLRTAHGLLLAHVPPRRVRRALSQLTRQLPSERPLSGIRVYADGRHVVVREGRTAWQPDSGQVVFTFAVDDLSRDACRVVPVGNKTGHAGATSNKDLQSASAYFERGLACEERSDLSGACAAYQQAILLDPGLADAYINLGRLRHLQGDAAEAVQLYHQGLAREFEDPVAHYNLGIALEDQGCIDEAVAHYRRAVAFDPAFADAHFNLGRLLDRLGRRRQALRHLVEYKKLTQV